MVKQVKRGACENPPKDLRWCMHSACSGKARQFLSTTGLAGLERHWVEKHGAIRKTVQKVKVEPTELFDREPYVRG